MREILFRSWNIIDKCFYYFENGTYYYFGKRGSKIIVEEFVFNWKSAQQFTGLLDKKGNKIFEGSIVRWDDNSNGEEWRVAVVEFNSDIQFRIIKIECDFIQSAKEGYVFRFGNFIYQDTQNHLEIIGNIHEENK